jgi:hypothetical protein
MPILQSSVKLATKPLPKLISPGVHAVADYITAAAFFTAGAVFFRRNKRAAMSSLVCGAAELATSLLTNYPGGVAKAISFPTHGKIDMGLAAITAMMPEFMDFEEAPEKAFFRSQALLLTAVTGLTDFGRGRGYEERFRREAA